MIALRNELLAVAVAPPLLMVVAQGTRMAMNYARTFARRRCVGRIAALISAEEEPSDEAISILRRLYTRRTLLNAVIFVAEHIYGEALNRLALVVEVCEVDYDLLRMLNKQRGARCVRSLMQIAQIATVAPMLDVTELSNDADNREQAFYLLMARVALHPERSICYIAKFSPLMTAYEVAMVTQLMRRVGAPMAYTPMLVSQSKNIQLVGICLVEQLLIVDAEAHLQRLAESETEEVAFAALHALCAIRGDISTLQVARAMKRFAPHHRASLLRHAVLSCYSLQSCAAAFNGEERNRFLQMSNSYKCSMLCN